MRVFEDRGDYCLEIRECDTEDSGEYTCTATNIHGSTNHAVRLCVRDAFAKSDDENMDEPAIESDNYINNESTPINDRENDVSNDNGDSGTRTVLNIDKSQNKTEDLIDNVSLEEVNDPIESVNKTENLPNNASLAPKKIIESANSVSIDDVHEGTETTGEIEACHGLENLQVLEPSIMDLDGQVSVSSQEPFVLSCAVAGWYGSVCFCCVQRLCT